jgi:hypothetical protein
MKLQKNLLDMYAHTVISHYNKYQHVNGKMQSTYIYPAQLERKCK